MIDVGDDGKVTNMFKALHVHLHRNSYKK